MGKKDTVNLLVIFALGVSMFFAGFYVGGKRSAGTISEFENRLADLTDINKQLQDENSRLRAITDDLSRRLTTVSERLDRAKDIIDGFANQVSADGDTIQRAIDTISKLEQLLSVIFEGQ